MNKVILYGNLTRDPELKSLPSGFNVASFGLATNRRVKKEEKWEEVPEFHNIVVFGRQAETSAQYLKKGSSVLIEGRIQTRSWETPEKGKQYKTEIVAESVTFGSRGGGGGAAGGSAAPSGARSGGYSDAEAPQKAPKDDAIDYPVEDINPDDIPF
ncbi:MAG TPA: single-stranded DNA-binding protein [Candidatus Paceibacterota bacterium]|jgi:single-strand DNA-binding protein|nr:single-stranded DNA-binding protein [Candidatus Paceibacterota bacterium]